VLPTLSVMSDSETIPPRTVTDFIATLPATYRTVFDRDAALEHAAIVARRNGTYHLEVWRSLPEDLYVLCLVADDRPGLLSKVTTALSDAGFHIEGAQIFTRKNFPTNEALDFFWVRLDGAVNRRDVEHAVHLLRDQLHDTG
jgi:UTP:GlnB (protein PII) uridylyltransferase